MGKKNQSTISPENDRRFSVDAGNLAGNAMVTASPEFYAYFIKQNASSKATLSLSMLIAFFPAMSFGLNALTLKVTSVALKALIVSCTILYNIDILFFLSLRSVNVLIAEAYAFEDILNKDQKHRPITWKNISLSLRVWAHAWLCCSDYARLSDIDSAQESDIEVNGGTESVVTREHLITNEEFIKAISNIKSIDFATWIINAFSEGFLTWESLQNYVAFAKTVGESYPALKPLSWTVLPGLAGMNFPGVIDVIDLASEKIMLPIMINFQQLFPSKSIANKIDEINKKKNINMLAKRMGASLEAFMKTRAFPDHMPEGQRRTRFLGHDLSAVEMFLKETSTKEEFTKDDQTKFLVSALFLMITDPKWNGEEEAQAKSWSEYFITTGIYLVVISSVLILFTMLLMLLGIDDDFSVSVKVISTWVNIAVALIGGVNFSDALVKKIFADQYSAFTLSFDDKKHANLYTNLVISLGYFFALFSSGSVIAVANSLFNLGSAEKYCLYAVLIFAIAVFNGSDVLNQVLMLSKVLYQYFYDKTLSANLSVEASHVVSVRESDFVSVDFASDNHRESLLGQDQGLPLIELLKQEQLIPLFERAITLMPVSEAYETIIHAKMYKLVMENGKAQIAMKVQPENNYDLNIFQPLLPVATTCQATTAFSSMLIQLASAAALLYYFSKSVDYKIFIIIPSVAALLNSLTQLIGKTLGRDQGARMALVVIDALYSGAVTLGVGISSGLFIAYYNHIVDTALLNIPMASEYTGELSLLGCAAFSAVGTATTVLQPWGDGVPEPAKKSVGDFFKRFTTEDGCCANLPCVAKNM